jgi:hypothetical protein
MAFAKLKAHLRRISARTIDAPLRAVGDICSLYSQQECWSYLKDAGYRPIERSGSRSIEPLADPASERSFTLA